VRGKKKKGGPGIGGGVETHQRGIGKACDQAPQRKGGGSGLKREGGKRGKFQPFISEGVPLVSKGEDTALVKTQPILPQQLLPKGKDASGEKGKARAWMLTLPLKKIQE